MKRIAQAGIGILLGLAVSAALLVLADQYLLGSLSLPHIPTSFGETSSKHSPIHFQLAPLSTPSKDKVYSPSEMVKALIPLGNGVFHHVYDENTEERLEEAKWMYFDSDLGRNELPFAKARHQLRQGNRFIFNVEYRADQFGRRITPISRTAAKKFIALFGCSMTFGHGLHEDETLPYFLGKLLPDFMPYNYAVGGTGTAFSLARMQQKKLPIEIAQKQGIGLYMYIDDHLGRSIGNSFWSTVTPGAPNYFLDSSGVLQRDGSFASAHPIRSFFYRIFYESNLSKRLGIMLPPYVSDSHRNLICAMMENMKTEFLQQFPGSQFYVGFLPVSGRDFDSLSACLAKRNVPYLDLRNSIEGYTVPMSLAVDHHPTPQANQAIASAIVQLLKENTSLSTPTR